MAREEMPEDQSAEGKPSSSETNEGENAEKLGSTYLFRGDDDYVDGEDLGEHLDDNDAEIQTPWEHVRDREAGQSTRFASFSQRLGVSGASYAGKFSKSGNVFKVRVDDLRELQKAGHIKILTPSNVEELMKGHSTKRIRRAAHEVRHMMEMNEEILIEGTIPAKLIQRCKNTA